MKSTRIRSPVTGPWPELPSARSSNPANTPRRLIGKAALRFRKAGLHYGHGTDNALDEAAWLVLGSLHLPFDCPDADLERRLDSGQISKVETLIERRVRERRPVAYLLGTAWFAGLEFKVDERVLVPRSPMAELIEERCAPWLNENSVRRVLDIGTGSGCIAIACAFAFPGAEVDAVDISAEALEVAGENVGMHGLARRVRCIASDLFAALPGETYDLILANPPYVSAAEYANLPAEYHYEPAAGLEAGADGLDVVRRILAQAPAHLNAGGVLVVEVGSAREALVAAYPDLPFTWLEFERGGEGVFLLQRGELP